MEKIIALSGRIDSTNAAQVEADIQQQLSGFSGDVVLDAADLAYISSAGLRVILRLKKANPSTKLVNCSSEVYEILDMTGFTEMMSIAKAYRKLSIEGCEVIGEGANGIVYRTDPDTIVKVYKNPDSLEEIHNERELARKAFGMGIPTAIPYDVVQVGDLYGSVFELLNAKSFAKLIRAGEPVEELARQSVEILKTIHGTHLKPGELPDKKKESMKWVSFAKEQLPAEIGEKLERLFNEIPETDTMLHGDYHIKNIMRQNGENLLIDMDTLSMGHPVYEFAAIYAAYVGFCCSDPNNAAKFFDITLDQCRDMWRYTLKYYFDGKSEEYVADVVKKAEIICYTRLLRWYSTKRSKEDADAQRAIAFCKDYLIKTIPTVDSLSF